MSMLEKLQKRSEPKGPRRPRSKAESEKRRRALILLLIVVAIVASLGTVGYGYYNTDVKPWHQRIVKVNGTVIEMRAFVKTLRLNGATDSSSAASCAGTMEENELKRQYLGSEFGVTVSDNAVDAELRTMLVADNATEDQYQEALSGLRANLKNQLGLSIGDLKKLYVRPSLVDKELREQISDRDYPSTDNFEHAQVQALLIKGSDNATTIRTRWETGESFKALSSDNAVSSSVRDFSADNTTINWVAKGIKSEAFDNCTFAATYGALSDPIEDSDSPGNYWVIKVIARESMPLSDADRGTLVGKVLDKWLEDAKKSEDNNIVNYVFVEGGTAKGGTAKLNFALDHVALSG